MSASGFSRSHANETKTVKLGNPNGIRYEKQEQPGDRHSADKPAPKRRSAKVDLYDSNNTLILPKAVSEDALKRFSMHARQNISLEDPKTPTYTLPGFSCCQPYTEAVRWVMDWCQTNESVEEAPSPTADDVGGDLVFKIDVYATMKAMEFVRERGLEDSLHDLIKAEPISAQALIALWDLLGNNASHRLMQDALFSLNRFYRQGKIDAEENRKMENYMTWEEELEQAFADNRNHRPRKNAPVGDGSGDHGGDATGGGGGGDGSGSGDAVGDGGWRDGVAGQDGDWARGGEQAAGLGGGVPGGCGWGNGDHSGGGMSW